MPNPYAPPDPNAPPPPERQWPPRDAQGRPEGGPGEQGSGGPGHGGRGPGGTPKERRTPTPEEARKASGSVLKFGVLLFCGLLALRWPIPWQGAAPLFFLAGIVFGVRALLVHRKVGLTGPFMIFLAVGVAMAGMLAFSSLAPIAVWEAQLERQECLDSALTLGAQEQCETEFAEAVAERFGTE